MLVRCKIVGFDMVIKRLEVVGGTWKKLFSDAKKLGCLKETSRGPSMLSHTKHIWYSEHGMYCQFEIILEQAMSATHVAVIPHMRTHSDEEEFLKK